MVQGVGFRPFVARLATSLNLTGSVSNTGRGVEIDLTGEPTALEAFLEGLKNDPPPMALLTGLEIGEEPLGNAAESFTIEASRVDPTASVMISPDIATCQACLAELSDPQNRRHRYPFTNCTNCGPRYTIIEAVPYDRARTSMKTFPLCSACADEFSDPANRRFHAQPNACPTCGPKLTAHAPTGEELSGDPIALAATCLGSGGIVALLGLGGVHLACDACDETAVKTLRARKNRAKKPFAVMCATLGEARNLAEITVEVGALLSSPAAPIILCPSVEGSPLAPSVAPGQSSVGVFLPYTPLHHLLFMGGAPRSLVMTSGNRSDEPILSNNGETLRQLGKVVDLFLLHDRPIVHPVDDSVVRATRLGPVMVRRARGYAPRPVALGWSPPSLVALGAELLNTVTVTSGNLAFVGPHLGDLKNLETEEGFRRNIAHLMELLRVTPRHVVCDLHPDYRSSRVALELEREGLTLLRVQHHEAHGSACMAENGVFDRDGVVVALDGVGLGHDGKIWGGELLVGRPGNFRRVGHLREVGQPGGDAAARQPWRMAASWLKAAGVGDWKALPLSAFTGVGDADKSAINHMLSRGLNSPATTSCGRLFDAAAAILGFAGASDYTAQAPMEFEALAAGSAKAPSKDYPHGLLTEDADALIVDPAPLLLALLDDALSGSDKATASRAFHDALSATWATAAHKMAKHNGIMDIFLTGGCFQNALLLESVAGDLTQRGYTVHLHRNLPPNDGCISLGQAAWAASRIAGGGR